MPDELVPVPADQPSPRLAKKLAKYQRTGRKAPNHSAKLVKAVFGVEWGRMEAREDRETVAMMLLHSPIEKIRILAEEALLPMQAPQSKCSFAYLAKRNRVTIHEIARCIVEAKKDEGFLRVADRLPRIMEQVADDAESKWEKCLDCDGSGQVDGERDKATGMVKRITCKPCRGRGLVYVEGNQKRIQLLFETFELTGRIAGQGVNVNLDLRDSGRRESLEDLSASVGDVIDVVPEANDEAT